VQSCQRKKLFIAANFIPPKALPSRCESYITNLHAYIKSIEPLKMTITFVNIDASILDNYVYQKRPPRTEYYMDLQEKVNNRIKERGYDYNERTDSIYKQIPDRYKTVSDSRQFDELRNGGLAIFYGFSRDAYDKASSVYNHLIRIGWILEKVVTVKPYKPSDPKQKESQPTYSSILFNNMMKGLAQGEINTSKDQWTDITSNLINETFFVYLKQPGQTLVLCIMASQEDWYDVATTQEISINYNTEIEALVKYTKYIKFTMPMYALVNKQYHLIGLNIDTLLQYNRSKDSTEVKTYLDILKKIEKNLQRDNIYITNNTDINENKFKQIITMKYQEKKDVDNMIGNIVDNMMSSLYTNDLYHALLLATNIIFNSRSSHPHRHKDKNNSTLKDKLDNPHLPLSTSFAHLKKLRPAITSDNIENTLADWKKEHREDLKPPTCFIGMFIEALNATNNNAMHMYACFPDFPNLNDKTIPRNRKHIDYNRYLLKAMKIIAFAKTIKDMLLAAKQEPKPAPPPKPEQKTSVTWPRLTP
jgi:hypothetical protein